MPNPVLTVAAAWAAFDAAVANAEKVAVRRVFYAGAQAVLDILLAGLEPTVEVTEREVDRAEALSDELRRFGEEVDAGRACPAGASNREDSSQQSPFLEAISRPQGRDHSGLAACGTRSPRQHVSRYVLVPRSDVPRCPWHAGTSGHGRVAGWRVRCSGSG